MLWLAQMEAQMEAQIEAQIRAEMLQVVLVGMVPCFGLDCLGLDYFLPYLV